MKQHPDNVGRDLDDEVAEAIEHQYARRLMTPAVSSGNAVEPATPETALSKAAAGSGGFDKEIARLRDRSGF